jgi:aspartate racemase
MKTIGLIGGMSWESTRFYYEALNREVRARRGGLHSAPILLHSVDFAPIAAMQAEGRWDEAGALLAASKVRAPRFSVCVPTRCTRSRARSRVRWEFPSSTSLAPRLMRCWRRVDVGRC